MYVIVVGGGKVGYYLSKHLLDRGYEVTLIEKDPRRAEVLNSTLGEIVMVGDGDEMAFLATTGMERADVVVAVPGDGGGNLGTRQRAESKINVSQARSRCSTPRTLPRLQT